MIYDYEYFKKEIYSLTTIDLNAYKEKQMKRRIDTLIAKHKIVGYDKYVQALKTDRELFEEFVGYITINVSEFYRNPEQWKYICEKFEIDGIPSYVLVNRDGSYKLRNDFRNHETMKTTLKGLLE